MCFLNKFGILGMCFLTSITEELLESFCLCFLNSAFWTVYWFLNSSWISLNSTIPQPLNHRSSDVVNKLNLGHKVFRDSCWWVTILKGWWMSLTSPLVVLKASKEGFLEKSKKKPESNYFHHHRPHWQSTPGEIKGTFLFEIESQLFWREMKFILNFFTLFIREFIVSFSSNLFVHFSIKSELNKTEYFSKGIMKLSFASTHFFLLFHPKLLLHVSHGIVKILIFSFYSFVRIKKLSKSNKVFVHTTRHREKELN